MALAGDAGGRFRFRLDFQTFLGFHGLMQTIAPFSFLMGTTGELIHDHHRTFFDHIVSVPVKKPLRPQGVGDVVTPGTPERFPWNRRGGVGPCQPLLCQPETASFGIQQIVTLRPQVSHHPQSGENWPFARGPRFTRLTEQQWRSRLIDQNAVYFINDCKSQAALQEAGIPRQSSLQTMPEPVHPAGFGSSQQDELITQVIETELVGHPIGDISPVGANLLRNIMFLRKTSHTESQIVEKWGGELKVPPGEISVRSGHMSTLPTKGEERCRDRRDQCLSFAGGHLRDRSLSEDRGPHGLDGIGGEPQSSPGSFPKQGQGIHRDLIPGYFATLQILPPLIQPGSQALVRLALTLLFLSDDPIHPGPGPETVSPESLPMPVRLTGEVAPFVILGGDRAEHTGP